MKIEELLKLDAIKASDFSEFILEAADVKMTLRRRTKLHSELLKLLSHRLLRRKGWWR